MNWPALLANENVPQPAVRVLRDAGVSVVSVAEVMPSASDRAVLAYAREHALWVLTFDRDYGELVFAREVAPPPGIVFVRQSPQPAEAFGRAVLALLSDPATGPIARASARRHLHRQVGTRHAGGRALQRQHRNPRQQPPAGSPAWT